MKKYFLTHFCRILAIVGIGAFSATVYSGVSNFNTTPDLPQTFGYKVNWFAVKATNPAIVADALEIGSGVPANWESGMNAAYGRINPTGKQSWIFVSPSVKGWVFVVGSSLPYPVMHTTDRHDGIGQKFDALFSRLIHHFNDVQFFGSYRVVGFVAWVRAQKNKPMRVFAYGDGDVYANIGDQTQEEALLSLPKLSGLSPHDASERLFSKSTKLPDENDVLRLAEQWSLNPANQLESDIPMSLGLVIELPKGLAQ